MFSNHLKIALRNIFKHKTIAFINIFGLSVGFVVAILSILYIKNELSYEKWLPHQEQVYRVYRQGVDQQVGGWVYSPQPLATTLANNIAGVKQATNLFLAEEIFFSKGEKSIYLQNVAIVDSSFFEVFAFPFNAGDANSALQKNHSIVISERVANLFFGTTNPVGESLKLDDKTDYLITGVLKKVDQNTHLNHEVYLSNKNYVPAQWLANRVTTYIQKEAAANIQQITAQTDQFLFPIFQKEKRTYNLPAEKKDIANWKFQPIQNIHLHSSEIAAFSASTGAVNKIYLFVFFAFIVLFIASINYMNLATAKAAGRAKEVGMRKVSGARKSHLVGQFLTEAILQSVIALVIAMVLSELLLPVFQQITNRPLSFFAGDFLSIVIPLFGLSLLIGGLAGIYPAFFLSNFAPSKVLKGNLIRTTKGQFFRKSLVVTQFSVAITLIVLMLFVYKQIDFMQHQELGFNGEQVLTIKLNKADAAQRFEQRKSNFEQIETIQSVAFANNLPGENNSVYAFDIEGMDQNTNADVLFVTEDFDQTLDVALKEGRFFSTDYTTDQSTAFVVNERFIKVNNIENPIGQKVRLMRDQQYGQIIGVVKDFHSSGLQKAIEPLVMTSRKNMENYRQVAFKLKSGNWSNTVKTIKQEWAKIEPGYPVRFGFLDEKFAAQYKENESFGQILIYVTGLTLLIAMLGLFGLASFMVAQRTKEIGVRKVLGASITTLVNLLIKDFVKLVLIAGLIALPIGFFVVQLWLQDFAYATAINVLPFVISILAALLLAMLTVGYQSIIVSIENPIKALKSD